MLNLLRSPGAHSPPRTKLPVKKVVPTHLRSSALPSPATTMCHGNVRASPPTQQGKQCRRCPQPCGRHVVFSGAGNRSACTMARGGAQTVDATWHHQTPSMLSQHSPGQREWALLWDQADIMLNSREEERSFQKVLSMGHSARTLRLGKTPPHMERRALSHPKVPPPPPVIHPSQ